MDYSNKCRLCLKDSDNKDSVPLFKKEKDDSGKKLDEDVVHMISYCVDVQIKNITTLPAQICSTCYEDLKKCNNFKKKCQDSDSELKQFLEKQEGKDGTDLNEKLLTAATQESQAPKTEKEIIKQSGLNLKEVKIRIKKISELNGDSERKNAITSKNNKKVDNDEGDLDEDAPLSVIFQDIKKDNKGGKYQCSYCEETFRRQVAKQVHEKEHKVLYKCVLCYESFQTHLKLQKHRADVHNEDPYCCSFCSKTFSDVRTWTDHLKKNHVCCSKCKSYFKTQKDLDTHSCLKKSRRKGSTPEENRIQYDFPKTYTKRGKYSTERRRYSPKKNYYQLKKMRLLQATQSTEFVPVNTCPEDKFLTEESNNKQRGPFPCFRCDKDFDDKGSLICHQAVAHPGQPIDNTQRPPKKSVLFCKFCLSFFRHVSDMNAHVCQRNVFPITPNITPSSASTNDNNDKALPIPVSILKKTFKTYSRTEKIPDIIEKKPVVSQLLPVSTKSHQDIEIPTPSISKLFSTAPSSDLIIKQEKIDDEEIGESTLPEIQHDISTSHLLKPNKRKFLDIEPPESVFKMNPNFLATLGIRQDMTL